MDIHVGNLNYQLNEEELKALFTRYGEVASVKIARDKHTGESRGFGFVTMPDPDEALQAIEGLQNYQSGHRTLAVSKAHSVQMFQAR
jgi:RNA recognition motif-containing protein